MSSPLPVGIVRWNAPEPRVTVIVKAAYALREGRVAQPADAEPLGVDRASAFSDEELGAASDFAPRKALVDVLLVGQARSGQPAMRVEAGFRIGDLQRRFHAVSKEPCASIPLSAAYLRDGPEPWASAVRVGPLSPRSPERAACLRGARVDRDGAPRGPLGSGFDFGFFNAAPPVQQLAALAPGIDISLFGLIADGRERALLLPSLAPLVYAIEEPKRRVLTPLGMRLDTLTIDTDRALATLVFRGDVEAAALDRRTLLVSLDPAGSSLSRGEILDRLDLAVITKAAEAAETEEDVESIEELEIEPDPPTPRPAWEIVGAPTIVDEPAEIAPPPRVETAVMPAMPPRVETVVMPPMPAMPPRVETAVILPVEPPRYTPFVEAPVQRVIEPPAQRIIEAPVQRLVELPAQRVVELPVQRPEPAARPETKPDDIEIYAAIQAAIWMRHPSLPDLYARHGLDEATFRIRAREITKALDADAEAGASGRMLALDARLRAHVAAMRAAAAPLPTKAALG